MQEFLRQNHQIVQDFLKTSHMAVYNLSRPAHLRTMQNSDFNSDPNALQEQQKVAALESERTDDFVDDADGHAWQPNLQFLPAVGVESVHKIQWPNLAQLKTFNLT
mmetsp:Transcript_32864/g.40626  ORF Transcript_32864/g.40626 Transcript_32864/m.40626 type:complete len:106 (+) Transcript_32864:21-338(+)|eukprot:CAMPEP_0170453032 /NCGR_PEP_ID=MMETSP0123-20130129/1748_1 /TAXON_ID=182087 /ORGANISM="Favella ehrenbergii, Strain Fehren 1" /LENGTH=105 /DNA_ID=CAMNT_0010715267 /DNA_START=24 /DNA_END=341 /DNA_ORIENTATION=-